MRIPTPPPRRNYQTGNRCGHRPNAPGFGDGHQGADLPFLQTLQDRAVKLYTDKDWRHWTGRRRPDWRGGGLYENKYPRSELRAAIVKVARYLFRFVQVKDRMRVLRFPNNKGISRSEIQNATRLSRSRVRDALKALRQCKYIGSFQPREQKAKGIYRGRPAIRWVQYGLLKVLGCWRAFQACRKAFKMPPAQDPTGLDPVRRRRRRRPPRLEPHLRI